jgi:hypothetical protein
VCGGLDKGVFAGILKEIYFCPQSKGKRRGRGGRKGAQRNPGRDMLPVGEFFALYAAYGLAKSCI